MNRIENVWLSSTEPKVEIDGFGLRDIEPVDQDEVVGRIRGILLTGTYDDQDQREPVFEALGLGECAFPRRDWFDRRVSRRLINDGGKVVFPRVNEGVSDLELFWGEIERR